MTSLVRTLLLCALAAPLRAHAQDAGTIEPRAANPGTADAPGDVIRELSSDVQDAGDAIMADAGMPVLTQAPPPVDEATDDRWTLKAVLTGSARISYQGATAFPIDPALQPTAIAFFMTRLRVRPEVHLGPFALVAETDAATGALFGAPDVTSDLPPEVTTRQRLRDHVAFPRFVGLEAYGVRKLYLEYAWKTGVFRVGQQTSNWGLGLLTNDGARDPAPGDFGQAQFGDLTYRALLTAHPLHTLGGAWEAVETSVAADLVVRDTLADFTWGDRAFQAVVALQFARDDERSVGLYAVYRNQRNPGGNGLDTVTVDLAGRWQVFKSAAQALKVGFEVAAITGSATHAQSKLNVGQLGMAVKAGWRMRSAELLFDAGLATGGFRFGRDFKVGLVLFDHVLAYQTARSAARASHPSIGETPEGTELLGTGGAITGSVYLFPRLNYAIADWADLYGGPLFAFSTARLTDAYNGSVNALGGSPGSYLGTELDVGAQARFHLVPEVLLSAALEAALFLPGDAFRLPDSTLLAPIVFGRVRVAISL